MPERTIEYIRPWMAEYQLKAIFSDKRYSVVEASTKAGKTAGCLVWLNEQAMHGKENRNYWWVAPVHSQAKIAYRRMKRGLPKDLYKSHDSDQWVELPNGAIIWFKSGEKPDNLFGEDVYAAVIDEASRIKEESWHALRSTLTATRGPVRIIGNVKGRANWFYKIARRAQSGDPDMSHAVITAHDAVKAGILDAEEIEKARRDLPESVFDELYLAKPGNLEGRVYSAFDYAENIRSDVEDIGGSLYVGMDFNVDPMTAVIGSKVADQLHIWSEIYIRNGNTEEMAKEIRRRWPDRDTRVYPDPSGGSRKTSAPIGQTDLTILRDFKLSTHAPRAAPPIPDRLNEVNRLLKTADGTRRLFVHPDCKHLVQAFDELVYKEGTNLPDKSMGLDHITDALGYLVHSEFPIIKSTAKRRHFADGKRRGFTR